VIAPAPTAARAVAGVRKTAQVAGVVVRLADVGRVHDLRRVLDVAEPEQVPDLVQHHRAHLGETGRPLRDQ